jgi:hypothetical protein
MSVKKLEQQKKQMQKQLAELNEQIANNVRPKLEEVVELLEAHQDAVAQDKGIERLAMKLSRLVFGNEVKKGSPPGWKREKGREVYQTFDWLELSKMLIDAGIVSRDEGMVRGDLEKLYFGCGGIRFEHNKWNDKEAKSKWLVSDPKASFKLRIYWSKKK